KARLEILKSREENLQNLFTEAQERLTKVSDNANSYNELLAKLLLESLLILHENNVRVITRSNDVQIVQGVVDEALEKYKDVTGRESKVDVSEG
ncbi:V-type ATP synthase subunit E family protein, partial [Bacillus altitudinis]|uniref:V-type ATP synthase subunit E family protein n=1 Tax=Bacillus altitudinis TaxID=293387 RepID=UPI002F931831